VGTGMLSQIIRARELLATLVALKGLVLSVKRAVVTLQVFLATEATRAQGADKGLGWILSQGLLATAAVGGRSRARRCVGGRVALMTVVGGGLGTRAGRDGLLTFRGALAVSKTVKVEVGRVHAVVVTAVVRERRAGRGRKASTGSLLFVDGAEAVHTQEVLLFNGVELLSLLRLVGDLFSEVDKAKLVFGVELATERRLEGRVLGGRVEGVGGLVRGGNRQSGSRQSKFVFFVLGGEGRQGRELLYSSGQRDFESAGSQVAQVHKFGDRVRSRDLRFRRGGGKRRRIAAAAERKLGITRMREDVQFWLPCQ
jgi:hypothetical protein